MCILGQASKGPGQRWKKVLCVYKRKGLDVVKACD